ncbi:MAG: hypothetical protein HEP71_30245 [Roseivirga sp.]|nr:hypothetical protein [Roseivirga sp.]
MKNLKSYLAQAIMLTACVLISTNCGGDDDDTDALSIEDLLGAYDVVQECEQFVPDRTYVWIVTKGAEDNELLVTEEGGSDPFRAEFSATGITFPPQIFDGLEYSGTGTLVGSSITVDFQLRQGGTVVETCRMVATKQ